MRTTQRKGDIALARAISTFTNLNYDVSLPVTESAAYDLLVDDTKHLYKVQVKYTSGKLVDLRRIHSNSMGYVIKKYSKKSYDWLYVLRSNNDEYLIKDVNHEQSTITPQEHHKIIKEG